MRRTPVMLMAALALVPVTIWTMSGSASAASGSLTVAAYDRGGVAVRTPLNLYNVTSKIRYSATSGRTKSLPKGTYVVLASISTARDSSSTLGAAVVKVSGRAKATIDARSGKAVQVRLDQQPGPGYSRDITARVCTQEPDASAMIETWGSAGTVFVIPNKSKHVRFAFVSMWRNTTTNKIGAYVLSGATTRTIPAAPVYRFGKAKLATVNLSVRRGPSLGSDVNLGLRLDSHNDCQDTIGGMIEQRPAPYGARVYASPGTWAAVAESYALEKDQFATVGSFDRTLKLAAGKSVSQTYFRSAWGPADKLPFVTAKHLSFDTTGMFSDPGFGGNGPYGYEGSLKSTVTLSLGGKVVKRQNRDDQTSYEGASFDAKLPKKGWYTLNVAAARYRPGVRFPAGLMSPRTNLWMNFHADPKSDEQAPLILPRMTPQALDLTNTARKGSTTEVTIALEQRRQIEDVKYTKATAKTVAVQASFDAGRTWKTVRVKKAGGRYRAYVPNSRSGPVALRATVVTTGGYRTEVTIYSAYRAG